MTDAYGTADPDVRGGEGGGVSAGVEEGDEGSSNMTGGTEFEDGGAPIGFMGV